MRAKHCVPFRALVPCHFFLPSLVHRLVVFTVVAFSDGSKGPKSRFLTFEDVDQIQVLFHVNARCLRIQNAVLKTLGCECMHAELRVANHFNKLQATISRLSGPGYVWILISGIAIQQVHMSLACKPKDGDVVGSQKVYKPHKPGMSCNHWVSRVLE